MASQSFFSEAPLDAIILRLHSCDDLDCLEHFILNELPTELGASFASWNEHDESLHLTRVNNSDSHQEKIAPLVEALNQSLPTHPLFPKYFNFETGQVTQCDLVDRTRADISDDAFYQLPFYQEVAQHLGLEDQLVMHVFIENGVGILLTFHGERQFTEAEQLRAAILRGHIVARLYTIKQEREKAARSRKATFSSLSKVLSDREVDVLKHVCLGDSNQQVADALGISRRTAETHLANILKRLNLDSRFRLIARYGQWFSSPA